MGIWHLWGYVVFYFATIFFIPRYRNTPSSLLFLALLSRRTNDTSQSANAPDGRKIPMTAAQQESEKESRESRDFPRSQMWLVEGLLAIRTCNILLYKHTHVLEKGN